MRMFVTILIQLQFYSVWQQRKSRLQANDDKIQKMQENTQESKIRHKAQKQKFYKKIFKYQH